MARDIFIDGNNLLHAARTEGPIPLIGRETLVRVIERWAKENPNRIVLVFDGRAPDGPMAQQLASRYIAVSFSAPSNADDVIVKMLRHAPAGPNTQVVTSDGAIRREARKLRQTAIESRNFCRTIFASVNPRSIPGNSADATPARAARRPQAQSQGDSAGEPPANDKVGAQRGSDEWLKEFGYDQEPDEGFDGESAMRF